MDEKTQFMRRVVRKGGSLSLKVCVADWPQLEVNRAIPDRARLVLACPLDTFLQVESRD